MRAFRLLVRVQLLKVFTIVVDSVKSNTRHKWLLNRWDVYLFLLAAPDGPGKAVWDFVCDVVCEDLCQPNDLPVVLLEQKSILIQAFAVLQALYRCQDQWCSRSDTSKFFNVSAVLQLHILPQIQLWSLNDVSPEICLFSCVWYTECWFSVSCMMYFMVY